MKKVLYLVTSLNLGGAETLVINLCEKIKEFETNILAMNKVEDAFYESKANQLCNEVLFAKCKKRRFILNNYRVYKMIKKNNPDIIHVNDSILAKVILPLVLLRKTKKTLYTIHTDPERDGKSYRKLVNLIALKLLNIKFIAINESNLDKANKFYNTSKIELVQNGIDINKYTIKSKKNINKDKEINFVNVARFFEVKNHKFLIDIFYELEKEYPNSKLHLFGDGPLLNEIKEYSQKIGLYDKISFYGNVKNINEILSDMDIFIFPSLYEGSPLAIIEALATGIPIVASNRGGIPSLVKNYFNGFVCELVLEEFITKVKELIENEELYKKISMNNINGRKSFDIKETTDKYEKLYKKLVEC